MDKNINWLDKEIEKDNKFLEREKKNMINQIKNLDRTEIFKIPVKELKPKPKPSIMKKIMMILFNVK